MATAARRTANFNTLYSTALERWYNAGKVQDTIFEPTPGLWLMNQVCKETGRWSYDIIVNILESKSSGVDSFQYYDTVSTAPAKGPQSARFPLANSGRSCRIWPGGSPRSRARPWRSQSAPSIRRKARCATD